MKNTILISCLLLPFIALAQENKGDTVITKDAMNPNAEYWVVYSGTGKMKARGQMLNQKKEGVWREYQDYNGTLLSIEEYHNGEKNGAAVKLGTSASVEVDETYKNGKLEGQRTMYSYSRITQVEHYHDGMLNGNKKIYYEEEGKVEEDGDWVNNQREGKTLWFFKTGKPSIEYTYTNGLLNGPSEMYHDNGALASKGNFVMNSEDGKWEYFDDEGNPEKTVIYKNGTMVKEIPAKKQAVKKAKD